MLLQTLLFITSVIILIYSSTVLVSSLTNVAIAFKMSQFTVSFLLMAVATSLPELFIGLTATKEGTPILAVGNIIGSNIANLTLLIGIGALINKGIRVQSSVRKQDTFYMSVIAFTPVLLMFDGFLSRTDGLLLLLLYVLYLYRLIHQRVEYSKIIQNSQRHTRKKTWGHLFKFCLGIVVLLFSADMLVRSSVKLAEGWGLSISLVGLILVAIGTSLPELSFAIEALVHRRSSMVLGNILGSVVVNSSLILGMMALISPIYIQTNLSNLVTAIAQVLAVIIFAFFIRSKSKVSLWEGLWLILLYILFVVVELSL